MNLQYLLALSKKSDIFVCYNQDDDIVFGSKDKVEAKNFAAKNNCDMTSYPKDCFDPYKEENFLSYIYQ
jgi:hypothetical protein